MSTAPKTSKRWWYPYEDTYPVLIDAYKRAMSTDEQHSFDLDDAARYTYMTGQVNADVASKISKKSYDIIIDLVRQLTDCGCGHKRTQLKDAVASLDAISAFDAIVSGASLMASNIADGVKVMYYRRLTKKD